MSDENNTVLGFAWYDQAQWHLLARVVPDPSELKASFQEWEKAAREAIRRIEAKGNTIERVPVDVLALCAWCRERNLPVSGAARAEYVTTLLRKKHERD